MAANVRTEMRIPTRSAPRPPINSTSQRNVIWNGTNNVFGSSLTQQPVQKKKPPPRPPPPKFTQNYTQAQKEKLKKPVRPTELLTNLFGRRKSEHPSVTQLSSQIHNTILQSENTNGSICLIDFSPPGSPTFTTRSSSDGVSVDSFGSDGNSNPSAFTSSGNTSQTESAFEDDFDFFGISTKKAPQNDPWKVNSVTDPFGPLEVTNHNSLQSAKQMKMGQKINNVEIDSKCSNKTVPFAKPMTLDLSNSWQNNSKDNSSPPMPTIPPPAPPLEYLAEINNDLPINSKEPYGIALYDFPLIHAGDLPFKQGDVVYLIRKINEDWVEGRMGNQQGIFPINFIDIKVPLPGIPDNIVTAIYSFKGETAEDLVFDEGEKITVLSRISHDWLYGECGDRKGQFPVNYVNRIPCNLPLSH